MTPAPLDGFDMTDDELIALDDESDAPEEAYATVTADAWAEEITGWGDASDDSDLAYWAAEFSERETEQREAEHLAVYGPCAGQD